MALTLNFNPKSDEPSGYRDRIYVSRMNLNLVNSDGDAVEYPTRISKVISPPPVPPQAGFVNLMVVTSDKPEEEALFANKPFFLRIRGRKIFVLKRDFAPSSPAGGPAKLYVWFIARYKNGDPVVLPPTAATATFGIGNLVLTIETEDGFVESDPVDPPVGT